MRTPANSAPGLLLHLGDVEGRGNLRLHREAQGLVALRELLRVDPRRRGRNLFKVL